MAIVAALGSGEEETIGEDAMPEDLGGVGEVGEVGEGEVGEVGEVDSIGGFPSALDIVTVMSYSW